MGGIIQLDGHKTVKKQSNSSLNQDAYEQAAAEYKADVERLTESGGEEGVSEFLHAMGELAAYALDGLAVEALAEQERKEEEEFLKRNREIIKNEPRFDSGLQMQYYAGVMLGLVDKVFHTEDGFSQLFDDFSRFMDRFDAAFSKYSRQYPDLEEEYQFTGEMTFDVAELERMIKECLQETVRLKPNENDKDKTRLLYCGSWLFGVYRNMLYYISAVWEKKKGRHGYINLQELE